MNLKRSLLDLEIEGLEERLATLSRRAQAAFFLSCGEGLLPYYEAFARDNELGESVPRVLENCRELVWAYATGSNSGDIAETDLLSEVESFAPDGEKFDAPASTFAQDVVICFYEALRCAIVTESVNISAVEFVLEPAVQLACQEATGFLYLGDSSESFDWYNRAPDIPSVRAAIECCSTLINLLVGKERLSASDRTSFGQISKALGPDETHH